MLAAVGFCLWAGKVTDLQFSKQIWFVILAGAGMGFMLGPATTDAVNRASRLSYGEATGITQTVRNFAASLGLAILGTILVDKMRTHVTASLVAQHVPPAQASSEASRISQSQGSGSGGAIPHFIRLDFAEATHTVLLCMSGVMAVGRRHRVRRAATGCAGRVRCGYSRGGSTMTVPEAPLVTTGEGLSPQGEGWFVVNARESRWLEGHFGAYTRFEGDVRFPQLGINIGVLEPGQPACMYHGEDEQEDFLVLAGECLLLIEGEERPLKAWDFVHCPKGTEHVFVGAGYGPVRGAGGRQPFRRRSRLPGQRAGATARRRGPEETHKPEEAYAGFKRDTDVAYREGWLP